MSYAKRKYPGEACDALRSKFGKMRCTRIKGHKNDHHHEAHSGMLFFWEQ